MTDAPMSNPIDPAYRHGTHLLADGGPYSITGRLPGDHDDLDGLVNVLTDDGECLALNGWMFTFEVLAPPAPAQTRTSEPDARLPFAVAGASVPIAKASAPIFRPGRTSARAKQFAPASSAASPSGSGRGIANTHTDIMSRKS